MVYGDQILNGSRVRAVICDIYGTLLHAGPPPPDAPVRWEQDCAEIAGHTIPLETFDERCAEAIAAQHAVRRVAGEAFPEVDWMAVIRSALPCLDETRARQISSLHAACRRTCTATPGALRALASLRAAGVLTGLASNAQHYTRDELAAAGFALPDFHPSLCFLSGDHGYAKPSPRVFALLTERLAALGIAPHEALMIGDSFENDIEPARAAGWQACMVEDGIGDAVRAALD